jgi:hypothetical protein
MCIPKPFATVEVVYGPAVAVPEGKEALRRGMTTVAQALHEVTQA